LIETLLTELKMVSYQSGREDGTFMALSEAIESLTGYPREAFLQGAIHFDDLIDPADRIKKRQTVSFCLNDKIPYAVEYRITHHNGESRWILDKGVGEFDETGQLSAINGILIDTTQEKRRLDQLKARKAAYKDSAAQFEAILDQLPALIFYKDRNNCLIRVNQYLADAYGLPKEALAGRNISTLYPQDVAESYYQDDLAVMASGEARLDIVEKWETTRGLRWVNTSKIPFVDDDGEIIGIIGMSFDITARIEAEKKVRVLQQAVEQAPNAIVITEPDGSICYVNQSFLDVTGYTEAEVIGQNPRVLKYNKEAGIDFEALWQTIQSGKEWQGIFQNRKKNGQPYWERAVIAPIYDDDGSLYKYVGMKQDITQEHENRLEMEKLYHVDMLTKVFNRRSFFEQADEAFARSQTAGSQDVVFMLDIDFFKHINDTYGHSCGDEALRLFAEVCIKTIRKTDLIGRIGGEEFAIYLSNTSLADARLTAERLRANVADIRLRYDTGETISFTVSIGISAPHPGDKKFAQALKRADTALYQAKQNGRNRVETLL
jgi:diguanylate cyclase (GGDEF)-like protein/PAS domain S-box-containing protein